MHRLPRNFAAYLLPLQSTTVSSMIHVQFNKVGIRSSLSHAQKLNASTYSGVVNQHPICTENAVPIQFAFLKHGHHPVLFIPEWQKLVATDDGLKSAFHFKYPRCNETR